MKSIETMAKTLEEAIELALKELDAERKDVEIDVVSKGRAGILGLGSEPARVRVSLLEGASEVVQVATEVLESLLEKMDVDAVVNLKEADREDVGGPVFDVDGDDSGLLIGRRGETLRALQFMVGFLSSRKIGERVNLFLDISGYQERRYETLRNLASRVARRVDESGRSIPLEPMPPNERRVVHLALAEHPKVETSSIGEGDDRRVVVELREGG